MASPAQRPLSPAELAGLNKMQRDAVLASSVKMTTPLASQTVDPKVNSVVSFTPRNTGLVLGFFVEVSGTILNTAAGALSSSPFATANMLSNILFTDFNNYQRINATGYQMALLNSARQGFAFGGAYPPNLPLGFGNNYPIFSYPSAVASGANTAALRQVYWVPMAYSSADLRGAIFAQTVGAEMSLQLSINANPCAAAGGDPVASIYRGNAAATWQGGVTVEVTQVYLDQLPRGEDGRYILPFLDLNTIYDLKYTARTAVAQGQDFPTPYATNRNYLSTTAIFNNNNTLNAGSDVNYWSLVTANTTALFKLRPFLAAMLARQTFMADPPAGVYYFDHRDKPLNVLETSNLELNLNASNVASPSAQLIILWEAFANAGTITDAASLG